MSRSRGWAGCDALLGLLFVGGLACGDDATPTDASIDGAGVDVGADATDASVPTPAPPAPAALPVLTPCAAGWREIAGDEGVTLCEPWPAGGRAACASPADAHLPGDEACVALGPTCPDGDFAEGLAADAIYVDASAAPGGDGTVGAPLATIDEAFARAGPAGGTIALSKGEHVVGAPFDAPVSVVGACAAETRMVPAAPSESVATLTVRARVALGGVTISGPAPGIEISGAGAHITASGVVVEGARVFGLGLRDGAGFEGTEVAIRDTAPDAAGTRGYGIDLEAGSVALARAELAANASRAIYARGDDTTIVVEDSVIRDTRSQPSDGNLGGAMDALGGVSARFARTVFEGNRDKNVRVDSEGTSLVMEDCVARGSLPRTSDDFFGFGVGVASGAVGTFSRTLFEDNRGIGVATQHEGSRVTLTDVVIRDTDSLLADGSGGSGLDVQSGAEALVERVQIVRSTYQGIRLTGERCFLGGEDLTIVDTRPETIDAVAGFGMAVIGGDVELSRARLSRNYTLHVLVVGGGSVTLSDADISRGFSQQSDGLMGGGILALESSDVQLDRARFTDLKAVALWTATGSEMSATDLEIVGVTPADCIGDLCADNPGGFGAVSSVGGTLTLTRFVVSDAELCGVSVGEGAGLFVEDGWVRQSAIGVNVQDPGVDLAVLQREIAFTDNAQNLDTSVLAVPEAATGGL